jgi:hypothetical protein
MANIINCDNGVVSGISGLTTSADNSGVLQFQSSGTNTLTITTAGNVGVGTNSPTFAAGTGLQVKGSGFTSVRVSAGSNTGLDISQTNTTGDAYVYLRDNAPLIFGTNNTERMRIDSSGNVGIGTSSPTAVGTYRVLDINGTAGGYIGLYASSTKTGAVYAGGDGLGFESFGASRFMNFYTNNAERMRIDSSGNVGIGTSSPTDDQGYTRLLDISSNTGGATYYHATGTSTYGWLGQYNNNITLGTSGASGIIFSTGSTPGEKMRLNTSGNLSLYGGTTTATGVGITFPASQSASSDANCLDDYEEGTWTPTDQSGAGLSFSNTSGNCIYTKVGRTVTATFRVTYPSTGDGSFAYIGGLPFAAAGTTVGVQGAYLVENNYAAGATAIIDINGTKALILSTSGGSVVLGTNALLSGKDLRGVFVYQV